MLVLVKSMTDPDVCYSVDTVAVTCTCPAFTKGITRPCKHIRALPEFAGVFGDPVLPLLKAKPKEGKPMPTPVLYSIGHSNHPIEVFVDMLEQHGITTLVDVRTSAFSRYNPQFIRENLSRAMKEAKIRYVYGGAHLGGKSKTSVTDPVFIQKMGRLVEIAQKEPTAMMCSEVNPKDCHRATKLGLWMQQNREDTPVIHITPSGLLPNDDVLNAVPVKKLWHELHPKGQYGL